MLAGLLFSFAVSPHLAAQDYAAPPVSSTEINVERPVPGQTVELVPEPGTVYAIDFDPELAEVLLADKDMVLGFPDGGRLVFKNLVDMVERGEPSFFRIDGNSMEARVLVYSAMGPSYDSKMNPEDYKFTPLPELRRARKRN